MPRILAHAAVYYLRAHLHRGGVVAYPTESSYALGCLPTHVLGLRRVIALKKRPQHKGLISIGYNLAQLQPMLQPLNHQQSTLLTHTWPAAKTYLIESAQHMPLALRGRGRHKLAVRVPAHAGARQLCQQLGMALVSTSCNRSGERPCTRAAEVWRRFGHKVWVIKGRCGGNRRPSQIIDLASGMRLR